MLLYNNYLFTSIVQFFNFDYSSPISINTLLYSIYNIFNIHSKALGITKPEAA